MQLPDFEHKRQRWDYYKTFHVNHGHGHYAYGTGIGAFVQFVTGELIVTTGDWLPDRRRFYRDLNITVMSTADENCPALYHNGTLVTKAVLNRNGQQILLIDHDTKQAVRIDGRFSKHTKLPVPPWLWDKCYAYFAGPGQPPVGKQIRLMTPKQRTAEEREHVRDLIKASQMWVQHEERQVRASWNYGGATIKNMKDYNFLLKCKFSDLDSEDREYLSMDLGFTPEYTTVMADYLTIK